MSERRGWSPGTYRRITAVALAALAVIIVSGGAVRLTGSGLGCTDWPNCTEGRLVASLEYHPMIEFVNRLFTGAVSLAVILAVAGSLRRVPRRRDLTWWSLGLVLGVLGQIVLGGLVVLFELSPLLVIAHFLLSIVLVWNAVVLTHRAGLADTADGRPAIGAPLLAGPDAVLARLWFVWSVVVIVTGTVVTGSGPHGGDENVERLPFLFSSAARMHGTTVIGFLLLTVLLVWRFRAHEVDARVRTALHRALAVLVVQGAIGYIQYFTKVPVVLVGLHLTGATVLWIMVVRAWCAWREPAAPEHGTVTPGPVAVGSRA